MSASPKISDEKLWMVIPVHAQAIVWLGVIGNLQLALRHPMNTGPSNAMVRELAEQLLNKLEQEGVLTHEQSLQGFRDFC